MHPNKTMIREATPSDYPILKQIGMACFNETVDPERKKWMARFLFLRYFSKRKFKNRYLHDVLMMCLEVEGEMVGFYELESNGNLSSLYVLPKHHKKGYGKLLLKDAIKQAKRQGVSEMKLEASQYAHEFYKHFGFEDCQKAQIIFDVWMIPMKAKIL